MLEHVVRELLRVLAGLLGAAHQVLGELVLVDAELLLLGDLVEDELGGDRPGGYPLRRNQLCSGWTATVSISARKVRPMMPATDFMPAITTTAAARPSSTTTARGSAQIGFSGASAGWYLIALSVPRRFNS